MPAVVRRLRSLSVTGGSIGLAAVLVPVWWTHEIGCRVATRRRTGGRIPIPRVPADSVRIDHVVSGRRPVVVEGLADHIGIGDAATVDSLGRCMGDCAVDVSFHDSAEPFFLYSGGYDTEVVDRREMTVSDFLDMMTGSGPPAGTVVYQLFGNRSVGGRVADELDRFDRALRSVGATRTEPRFSGVWIGSPGVVTPLHHDAWPGLLFQTHGRKKVAMYTPTDRCNLSFTSPVRAQGRWSRLPGRSADTDLASFPRFARAERHETVLAPGDALFIPPFWAHEMEAAEANVSVPFRFATRPLSHLDPGYLRPVAETVRSRLAG